MPQAAIFRLRPAKFAPPLIAPSRLAVRYPLAETLTDNFDDDTNDASKWTIGQVVIGAATTLGTVNETNQRLEVTPQSGQVSYNYTGYVSAARFDLTGSSIFVSVTNAASLPSFQEASISAGPEANDNYRFVLSGGNLYLQKMVAGTVTNVAGPLPYVAATHQWWRLRHGGSGDDTIYADTAPSTAANSPASGDWVNRFSVARDPAIAVNGVLLAIGTGSYSSTTPTVVYFDGFNTATTLSSGTIHGSASGSISLTGTSAVTAKVHGSGAGTLGLSGASAVNVKLHAVGSGAISLSGASTGTVHNPAAHGAASGSLSLSGSGTAKLAVHAAGIGSISLTGAAQASLKVRGSASGSIGLSGSGTAKIALHGAAAGVLSLSGTGSAKAKLKASASSSLPLSGLGAATVKIHAAGAGSLPLTGSASSSSTHHGTAQGTISLTGSMAAKALIKATAQQAFGLSGSAASVTHVHGSATGSLGFVGSGIAAAKVQASANDNLELIGSGTAVIGRTPSPTPIERTSHAAQRASATQSAAIEQTTAGRSMRMSTADARRTTSAPKRAA